MATMAQSIGHIKLTLTQLHASLPVHTLLLQGTPSTSVLFCRPPLEESAQSVPLGKGFLALQSLEGPLSARSL